jgi:hypothetical protein
MDITGFVFVGLMIIIGILMFSILPVLTFLLYRVLRAKGKIYKNIGLTIFILSILGMITLGLKIILSPSGFGPEYENVEIKQKIGGKLLCESVYNADIHDWQYDINYKYLTQSGDTLDLGNGTYIARDWNKDEQLVQLDKWLILKTGGWYGNDKVIMRNIITDSTVIHELSDQNIEKDSLWRNQKIKSLTNYCCAETFVEKISGDRIFLKYKFRTDENLSNKYDERKITYKIDRITGNIKMIKIEK